jgi:LAS superfamily LD-carboxypeptidase LdcB
MKRGFSLPILWIILGAALIVGAGSYGAYRYYTLTQAYAHTTAELASTSDALLTTKTTAAQLADELDAERARNDGFTSQIESISGTVGTLTKLSQTDKELLQKYSRIYFLNENYVPQSLATIAPAYTLEPSRSYLFHTKALPYLTHMLNDAADAGVPMEVLSAYRSYGQQIDLKITYKVLYGAGANRFSADQGYSEHQLGTAIDLTTKDLGGTSLAFAQSKAGQWLDQNAYRYGFILSYPKGNTFYQYEPWHWRFVGVRLATYLHDHGLHFYDLDQRTIDTYLVDIFD